MIMTKCFKKLMNGQKLGFSRDLITQFVLEFVASGICAKFSGV